MKAVICFASALLLLGASVFTQAAKDELVVMTLNAEWLWTPHDNKVDGSKFNKGDMSPAAYERELSFYADLIKREQVDIVALSEIENQHVLNDLAGMLGGTWRGYFQQGRDTATGQDVGIISHLKNVPGSETDFNFPEGRLRGDKKGKRLSKVLGVRFLLPDSTNKHNQNVVSVVTAHFLSKRNDSPKKAKNRLRQAYGLRLAAKETAAKSDHLLVLGDFNDYRDSKVLKALRGKKLKNAETDCSNTKSVPARKGIDHILFDFNTCTGYKRVNLKRFSDHDGVIARFPIGHL